MVIRKGFNQYAWVDVIVYSSGLGLEMGSMCVKSRTFEIDSDYSIAKDPV